MNRNNAAGVKAIVLFLGLELCVLCNAVSDTAQWASEDDLEIRLSSPSRTLLLGEPITLRIAITNLAYHDVQFPNTRIMGDGFPIFVIGPEGDRLMCISLDDLASISTPSPPHHLAPGASVKFAKTLCVCALEGGPRTRMKGDYLFPRPGIYRVEVKHAIYDPEIDVRSSPAEILTPRTISDSLEITVVTPEGNDAKAFELWREGIKKAQYSWGGVSAQEEGALLRERYPKTVYGLYTRYSHALSFPLSRAQATPNPVPPKVMPDRTRLLEELLPDAEAAQFPLLPDLLVNLVESHTMDWDLPKAKTHLERIQRDYPNSFAEDEVYRRHIPKAWIPEEHRKRLFPPRDKKLPLTSSQRRQQEAEEAGTTTP